MAQELESYLFTDWPVQVVAIDYTGRLVALPGRGGLALFDLTQSKGISCIGKIVRQSKWDCYAIEWNPHPSHQTHLASTRNKTIELWTWEDGKGRKLQDLRAHTRAVSCLNWSRFNPRLLASCSYDSYIYLWDLRDCKKPRPLSTVSGASHLKWNSANSDLLATTHDGDVRIWDTRKGDTPVRYISAHLSKINGLDWSPIDGHKLLTCSLDNAVKVWDIFEDTRNAKAVCDHRAPVWRAKYTTRLLKEEILKNQQKETKTILMMDKVGIIQMMNIQMMNIGSQMSLKPPGNAILTVPLSTASQRTIINVPYLWNITNLKNPFQTFYGATSTLEFHWRFIEGEEGFQLLTWSKDQMLKLWNLDPRCWQLTTVQDIREEHPLLSPEVPEFLPNSSGDDDAIESSTSSDNLMLPAGGKPNNLDEEITQACNSILSVVWEEIDITNRSCTISVKSGNNNLRINITFPELYPENAVPSFEITDDSPVDSATKVKIREILRENAQSCLKNNERCLEQCLNSLLTCIEDLKVEDCGVINSQFHPYGLDTRPFGWQDAAIPFPRTSGAAFCANGLLVCFNRSTRSLNRKTEITPRSLSALSAYSFRNLSSFYNAETLKTGVKSNSYYRKALVILRDASSLMAFNRSLGQNYTIFSSDDPKELCEKNRKAAVMTGRADLVETWSLLGLIMDSELKPSPSASETPWASHPFGRKLLQSLLKYYTEIHDIQMLAMISCLLEYESLPETFAASVSASSPDESKHNEYRDQRISKNFSLLEEEAPNYEEALSSSHSSFHSENFSPAFTIINFPAEEERKHHENNCRFIEKGKRQLFDHYKLCYADLLYKCQLSNRRSEVLKFVSNPPRYICEKDFLLKCPSCHGHYSGLHCKNCKHFAFRCVICRIAVKGAFNFCLTCGHGGHTLHILKWFESKDVCATGCGCHCPTEGHLFDTLSS